MHSVRKSLVEKMLFEQFIFSLENEDELMGLLGDADCCICKTDGDTMPVRHECASGCAARAHPHCMDKWRVVRDSKRKHVDLCPVCRCRLGDVMQPIRKRKICGTPSMSGAWCTKPLGHLGDHE